MGEDSIVTPPEDPPPGPPAPPQPTYPGPGYQPGPGWQQPAGPASAGPAWSRPPGSGQGPGWIQPQGPERGPAWGGQPPRKGGRTWLWVLLGIGIVVLLVTIVGGVGCYACVRGVQKAAHEIKEGSYTISHDGETRWVWKGSPQPRDTAAPDAARDAETLAGARRIKAAIEAHRRDTGSYPDTGIGTASTPASGDRSLRGLLEPAVTPWPTNPWTNRPMTDDPHRGDFLYVLWDDGTYTLRVFLSTGEQDL